LINGQGQALYVFSNDKPDTSECTTTCLTTWPPLLSFGKPNLDPRIDPSMVGTIAIPGGQVMVTYKHMPLYYYSGDGNPSQLLGQGFKNFWHVIGPDGKPIMTNLP
jgi:predicted lipoprotein with Yx(FWY)xxD motif